MTQESRRRCNCNCCNCHTSRPGSIGAGKATRLNGSECWNKDVGMGNGSGNGNSGSGLCLAGFTPGAPAPAVTAAIERKEKGWR